MNDIFFYLKNEDVILIYKRMYSVWNKYTRKKESCVRKKEVGKRCGSLSGIFAYCRKDYKCYNVYRCDKRMSPAMRLLREKSVLF